ncbi:helix-turn-helix transcriptional regulator [Limosilactobacillus pontis]|uniref:helix-turn-helix domain-containing protein n=1 Tax=Limosilactobacillus pontis TaxID=35787 RepID=UPI002F267907
MKNRIRECRHVAGMSQKELSKLVGIKDNAISRYETGICEPSLEMWEKLANALNVIPDYLVGWSDDPKSLTLEQIAERREDKMHFYHVHSQHLPIDAAVIAENTQQAVSVALRHCYDWLPETTEKDFRGQLVANEVQVEADRWPRWVAGREEYTC